MKPWPHACHSDPLGDSDLIRSQNTVILRLYDSFLWLGVSNKEGRFMYTLHGPQISTALHQIRGEKEKNQVSDLSFSYRQILFKCITMITTDMRRTYLRANARMERMNAMVDLPLWHLDVSSSRRLYRDLYLQLCCCMIFYISCSSYLWLEKIHRSVHLLTCMHARGRWARQEVMNDELRGHAYENKLWEWDARSNTWSR